MANRKTSAIDKLRTKIWAEMVNFAAGDMAPTALEAHLKDLRDRRTGGEPVLREATGLWVRYMTGRAKPFKVWEPMPQTVWVDECEEFYPGTSAWFYSPIWYLLEDTEYLPSQILACVNLLPARFRDELLEHGDVHTKSAFLLADLPFDTPFQIGAEVSVWSLGAMACVLRRAELSGQSPLYRWAGVGILWVLQRLGEDAPLQVRPLLQEAHDMMAERMNSFIYPMGGPMTCPVKARDLERFSCEVRRVHAIEEATMNDDYESVDRLSSLKWFELH